MVRFFSILWDGSPKQSIFWVFAFITAFSVWFGMIFESEIMWVLPFALLLAYQTMVNVKSIYLLLIASLPVSTEIFFSNGLSTDFPSEPLIVGLMAVFIVILISKPQELDGRFFTHPLTIILLFHLLWTIFTGLLANNQVISFKFILAKFWYISSFFFLTGYLLKDEKKSWNIWWWVLIPLFLATLKVTLHHAQLNWGFKEINQATSPFFRNHVSYAAILAITIPIGYMLWNRYTKYSLQWYALIVILALLFYGLATAYTRAAYVSLFFAFALYFTIKWRLIRWVLLFSLLTVPFIFAYLTHNNKFLDYAPTERTISHTEFDDILAATYKLEDVSTSERYYRWIGGLRMMSEDPWTGIGPGNFYFFYKGYTLNKFATYVSKNPEKSGIHNYYLMVLVEQGWIGLLIFLILVFYTLILAERIYHETQNADRKLLIMGLALVSIVIDSFLLMNDMIETDKVGSFFFINMAILVNMDLKNKAERRMKWVSK
jgi:O-antigen ligase